MFLDIRLRAGLVYSHLCYSSQRVCNGNYFPYVVTTPPLTQCSEWNRSWCAAPTARTQHGIFCRSSRPSAICGCSCVVCLARYFHAVTLIWYVAQAAKGMQPVDSFDLEKLVSQVVRPRLGLAQSATLSWLPTELFGDL